MGAGFPARDMAALHFEELLRYYNMVRAGYKRRPDPQPVFGTHDHPQHLTTIAFEMI
jgi:hypothetical protein